MKGMRWGVRKYQNEDGSLTPEGKARYMEENKSHAVTKWEGRLAKAEAKGYSSGDKAYDKASDKLAQYKERDSARIDYARSTTTGRSVARSMLLGGLTGNGSYTRLRSAGMSPILSGGAVALSNIFSMGTAGVLMSKLAENSAARMRAQANGQMSARYNNSREGQYNRSLNSNSTLQKLNTATLGGGILGGMAEFTRQKVKGER